MEVIEGTARVEDVDAFVERIDRIGQRHDTVVQAFDARYVVDRDHVERAVDLARRERERGEGIAADAAVEILLYAAGRRQIQRALEMGVSAGECPVVAVAVGSGEPAAARDVVDLLEEGQVLAEGEELTGVASGEHPDRERVREYFDVGETELRATDGDLADLVRERVALLVVER